MESKTQHQLRDETIKKYNAKIKKNTKIVPAEAAEPILEDARCEESLVTTGNRNLVVPKSPTWK